MSIKIISNQSNEDDIIPNREKLKRHGVDALLGFLIRIKWIFESQRGKFS